MQSKKRQGGYTLIELFIVVGILVIVGVLGMRFLVQYSSRSTYLSVAKQTAAIGAQCLRFQQANQDSISSSAALPMTVTLAQLVTAGYPVSNATNTYGQSYECRFTKDTLGAVKGIVVSVGGRAMTGAAVRDTASMVTDQGGTGAFIDTARASYEPGANNLFGQAGVNEPIAAFGSNPGIGHVADAFFFSHMAQAPGLADTSLQRVNTPGHPEYNRMQTAIDMNSNDVTNARTVAAGFLGTNALSPNSGYPAGWTGGVHARDVYGEGSIGAGSGGTLMASMTSAGEITGVNATLSNDLQFGAWLRANGDGGLYWQKYGVGLYAIDTTWLRVYNDKNFYTGGQIQAGSIVSGGRVTASEFLQVNGIATLQTSCSTAGLMAKASDGSGFAKCFNGVWTPLAGLVDAQQTVSPDSACGNTGNVVTAQCPAGTRVTGGGYYLNAYRPLDGATQSAPTNSWPNGNGWAVFAGGPTGNSCFVAYAVCGR